MIEMIFERVTPLDVWRDHSVHYRSAQSDSIGRSTPRLTVAALIYDGKDFKIAANRTAVRSATETSYFKGPDAVWVKLVVPTAPMGIGRDQFGPSDTQASIVVSR